MKSLPTAEHRLYTKYKPVWARCRAAAEGGSKVKQGNFLVKPSRKSWTPDDEADWKLYQTLAVYYNATGRTLEGLMGLMFKVPPQIDVADAGRGYAEEFTADYRDLADVARLCVSEILTVGGVGLLVDYPGGDETGMTVAQRMALGRRPAAAIYQVETIPDWRIERVNGRAQLAFVKLRETVEEAKPDDEFERVQIEQYRVLDLAPLNPEALGAEGGPRYYRQRVFRQDEKKEWFLYDSAFPEMAGRLFDYIPFLFMSPAGAADELGEPVLGDLAELNLAHYQNSGDLEWGLHFAGSPTPIFSGAFAPTDDPSDDAVLEIRLGSRTGIHFQDPGGGAKYLEFTGQGLGALKDAMEVKWATMATLGARIIAPERRAAESKDTARIHREGESSILANVANVVSAGLTWAMKLVLQWGGLDAAAADAAVHLNTEYADVILEAGTVDALVKAWLATAIHEKDMFYTFQRAGLVRPEWTFDQWREEKQREAPPLSGEPSSPAAKEE